MCNDQQREPIGFCRPSLRHASVLHRSCRPHATRDASRNACAPLEHVHAPHANVRTIGTQACRTAGRGESQSDARARGRRARVQPPPAPGASLSHPLAAVLVGLRVCGTLYISPEGQSFSAGKCLGEGDHSIILFFVVVAVMVIHKTKRKINVHIL